MKTNKIIVALITLVVSFFLFTATAFSSPPTTLDVSLLLNSEPVFSAKYTIPFSFYLKLNARYKKNYENILKLEYKGDLKAFFSDLNVNIYDDIRKFCNSNAVCPSDARAQYEGNGKFSFKKETSGKSFEYLTILSDLMKNNFSPTEISYRKTTPSLTVADLKKSTQKISSFCTDYGTSSENRKKNIELAVKRINRTTVYPEENFSFNAVVGKRTTENGFSEAKVILNGEYVNGIGGGVCQVASTLMNAWIKAGLDVSYSRSHSLLPSYLPPGTDCAVSDNVDLLLKNTSAYPVYIDSYADGTFLNFTIYGLPHEYVIKIESELIKEIPYAEHDTKENVNDKNYDIAGEKRLNGKIYRSFLSYYKDGKIEKKKFFRISYYLPCKEKKLS